MLTYKIEQKGGLVLMLPTKTIKPSQRCPQCGAGHKAWADMSVLLVGLRFHKTVVR
jgi:putative transposase